MISLERIIFKRVYNKNKETFIKKFFGRSCNRVEWDMNDHKKVGKVKTETDERNVLKHMFGTF